MIQLISNFQLSWKTSVLGICLIIGGTFFCFKGQWEIGGGFITAGLNGLISKDYDDNDAIELNEYIAEQRDNRHSIKIGDLHKKIDQLIDIVTLMQDINPHKRAEIYNNLNQKLKELK